MPNFAIALKEEICRLARREIKQQTGSTKRAVVQCRKEIAKLRRQLQEQQSRRSGGGSAARSAARSVASTTDDESNELTQGLRFSARSVRAQRRRLGLSAEEYAKLMGVSALTIYNWEHGRTRPREAQFLELAGLRNISKREARDRLAGVIVEPANRKPR